VQWFSKFAPSRKRPLVIGGITMFYARVTGTVVATRKDPKLAGLKLMVIQKVNYNGEDDGESIIAVDFVRAGLGDLVFCTRSKDACWPHNKDCPIDAGIMGIIDTIAIKKD
jgi:ethanolamine utilization protein EutN